MAKGKCERCGRELFELDIQTKICEECFHELNMESNNRQTVTREMAIDAGMPEIEGWEIG